MNGTDLPGVPSRPWDDLNEQYAKLQEDDARLLKEEREKQKAILIDNAKLAEAAIQNGKTKEDIRNEMTLINMVKLVKVKRDPVTGETKEYNVIDNQKAALYLIDKYSTISIAGSMGSVVWLYNGTHYEPDKGLLHAEITNMVRIFNLQTQRTTVSEIVDIVRGTNYHPESPFNYKEGWINCRNGLVRIDFEHGEIRGPFPHEPDAQMTYCLPVDYNPEAPTEPVLDVFKQWVLPEDVESLIQIIAQGFLQAQFDKTFKKSYLLQGETNSGKSTYAMEFLGRFCGRQSGVVSHVSLQDITENNFSLAELENKILNVFDDLSTSELTNYGRFKNITGATHHDIQVKHKSSYRGRIYCNHVYTCNIPPKVPMIVAREPAFWGRFEFINFPYEFETNTKFCDEVFTDQFMSGALNLVIAAMLEIHKNDKLMVRHTPDEVRDRWMMSGDPLCQFLDEEFDESQTETNFDKDLLYTAYLDWVDNHKPVIEDRRVIKTKEKFSRDLQKYEIFPGKCVLKNYGKKETVNCYKTMMACPQDLAPCSAEKKRVDSSGRVRITSGLTKT